MNFAKTAKNRNLHVKNAKVRFSTKFRMKGKGVNHEVNIVSGWHWKEVRKGRVWGGPISIRYIA